MPQRIPPAGADGLPSLVTIAFAYVDAGYNVWDAFWIAVQVYAAALFAYLGDSFGADIGSIGE